MSAETETEELIRPREETAGQRAKKKNYKISPHIMQANIYIDRHFLKYLYPLWLVKLHLLFLDFILDQSKWQCFYLQEI